MFKARTGARFVEYLTKIRLVEASYRLLNTAESVSSICYAIGYRDLSNFQRMFRQHGATPSAHRRKQKRQYPVEVRTAVESPARRKAA
ncbi:helix-turn-helix domain-containing protein [Nonomuraea sp. NPDC049784]|uniref:helix-turn-helix domain-containing protein n=1 Tax=Nonomuraea sp. NPDC049784 TaxID=3154361 RepID=UPI0033EA1381